MAGEEELTGGNTTTVVRLGDTVRRPVGWWTPAVHDLLAHLRSVGFAQVPRVLGVDDRQREVLEFVPGEVGTLSPAAPLPRWFRTPGACRAVGSWIRAFQHAQAGFVPDVEKPWRRAPGSAWCPGRVLVHHDVSPYNTLRRPDGSLVVLDWDFVRPGEPLEDLAWAAWRWAPLMAGSGWRREYALDSEADALSRQQQNLAALIEGYAPSAEQCSRLAEEIPRQMTQHAADLVDMARVDPAFAKIVASGAAEHAARDADWWSSRRAAPLRSVLG